jgi:hypothetical protein
MRRVIFILFFLLLLISFRGMADTPIVINDKTESSDLRTRSFPGFTSIVYAAINDNGYLTLDFQVSVGAVDIIIQDELSNVVYYESSINPAYLSIDTSAWDTNAAYTIEITNSVNINLIGYFRLE